MMVDVDIARMLRLQAEDLDVPLDEAVALEQRASRHEASDEVVIISLGTQPVFLEPQECAK